MKGKLIGIFLFAVVLIGLSLYFVVIGVAADELTPSENITYTPSSETHCIDKVCTLTLYSGVRYVFEDEVWKKVEEAKSLKNVWQKVYLEKDPNFDIEVVDVNYTDIELALKFNSSNFASIDQLKAEYPECGSSKTNDIKCDFKLAVKEYVLNETSGEYYKTETKFQYKYQEKDSVKESLKFTQKGNPLGKEYTFGGNSTTIMLQDADTKNLEDTYVRKDQADTNYGGEAYMLIDTRTALSTRIYIKFNISSIPSVATIDSATFYLYKSTGTSEGDMNVINIHHVTDTTWDGHDESDLTSNNQVCGVNFDDSADCNLTAEDNYNPTTSDYLWYDWSVTNAVNSDYTNDNKNVSFALKDSLEDEPTYSQNVFFRPKEYTTTSLRPYLNITYSEAPDETPPTYSLNSTNSTIAGTPVSHNLNWTDDVGLDGYIFSFDNCTGTLVNDTDIAWENHDFNQTETLNITGSNTTSPDYLNVQDGESYNVTEAYELSNTVIVYNTSFELNNLATEGYTTTDWDDLEDSARSGSHSAHVDGGVTDTTLTINTGKDLTSYDSCTLSAYINIEANWDGGEYICMDYAEDGSTYSSGNIGALCIAADDGEDDNTFRQVSYIVTDTTGITDFKWRFRATVSSSQEEGWVDDVNLTCEESFYRAETEHNTTLSYSGELINISASVNFTSNVTSIFNLTIFDFNAGTWDYSKCSNGETTADTWNYWTCNITENVLNYNSSDNTVRIRLNGTEHETQGEVRIDYVNYKAFIYSTNDNWTAFPSAKGPPIGWSNVTKTINSTEGCTIRWCFYANDTTDNWNGTSCATPFSYVTTTSGDSCDWSSGDFEIDCSESCEIDAAYDIEGNDAILTGAGEILVSQNVGGIGTTIIESGCVLAILDGVMWG